MSSEARERRRVRRQYDWSKTPPSVAIIESIAAFERPRSVWGVDVLDRPLEEYIDTDAVDALVRNETRCSLSFSVSGYHVWIDDDTVNVISDPDAEV